MFILKTITELINTAVDRIQSIDVQASGMSFELFITLRMFLPSVAGS